MTALSIESTLYLLGLLDKAEFLAWFWNMDPPSPSPRPNRNPLILAVPALTRNLPPAFVLSSLATWLRPKVLHRKDCKYLNLHIDFPGQVESSFFLKRKGCSPFSDYPALGVAVQAFVQRF